MGFNRMHTTRKPVGSGSLARSSAEHSPSVGQYQANPYANTSSFDPGPQELIAPLHPRPKSNTSATSDEFFDIESTPDKEEIKDEHSASVATQTQHPHIKKQSFDFGGPVDPHFDPAERSGEEKDDTLLSADNKPDLSRTLTSVSTTTTTASLAPTVAPSPSERFEEAHGDTSRSIGANHEHSNGSNSGYEATGWYGYTPSNASAYPANSGYGYNSFNDPNQQYSSEYDSRYLPGNQVNYSNPSYYSHQPQQHQQYQGLGSNGQERSDSLQNQGGFHPQYDQYHQYPETYAQGYDPYQLQGYSVYDPAGAQSYGMSQNIYPNTTHGGLGTDVEQSSNSDLSSVNGVEHATGSDSTSSSGALPTNSSRRSQASPSNSTISHQRDSISGASTTSAGAVAPPKQTFSSKKPISPLRMPEVDPNAEIPPDAIYNYQRQTRNTSLPRELKLQMNSSNVRGSTSTTDLSPRSSVALDTPTSAVSQNMAIPFDSPISGQGSLQSGGDSSIYGTNSNGTISSQSHHQPTPAVQSPIAEVPEEQKDVNLGIGIGSAYVQRLRADAGETHISRQPMNLPIGLKRTAKSAPVDIKPDFLRRAMDIRYTHLPQRMLETEVDDDDEEEDVQGNVLDPVRSNPVSVNRNSQIAATQETHDSPRGSVSTSHRSNSPVDSIIEQTGKIKLFVANPDEEDD